MNAKYALVAAICIAMTGCGAGLAKVVAPGDATAAISNPGSSTGANAQGQHRRGNGQRPGGRRGGGGEMGMISGKMATAIGLTDAQKASIKAILTAGRPARPAKGAPHAAPDPAKLAAMKAAGAAFKAAMASDPLDTAALQTIFADRAAKAAAGLDKQLAKLTAVRAVLTPAQCTQLAALITAQAATAGQHKPGAGGPGGWHGGAPGANGQPHAWPSHAPGANGEAGGGHQWAGHGSPDPNAPKHVRPSPPVLTDAQKTALKALMTARMGGHKPGERMAAMAAFWSTGDTSALKTALTPVDVSAQTIAFLSSLSAADRSKMGGMMMGGGMGGRGGRGGRGGHGGHGGHPGGEKPAAPATTST